MERGIAYYRVSTAGQGRSGLGLEAQRDMVQRYARQKGIHIVADYTEIETGTNKRHRPKLQEAIGRANQAGAVLLIAKLDRLARNVHFITGLKESGVKFVACDMPEANEMTVNVIAVMAQEYARQVSENTRRALAAAKRRGVKLGTPENLTQEARQKGADARRMEAIAADQNIVPYDYLRVLREDLGLSYGAIAKRLNGQGKRTRNGGKFYAATVYRMLQRAEAVA